IRPTTRGVGAAVSHQIELGVVDRHPDVATGGGKEGLGRDIAGLPSGDAKPAVAGGRHVAVIVLTVQGAKFIVDKPVLDRDVDVVVAEPASRLESDRVGLTGDDLERAVVTSLPALGAPG